MADKTPVVSEPLVAREPLQPPLAVHEVALEDAQVSAEVAPAEMLAGLADIDTDGGGGAATLTVTALESVPPAPVHASSKVVVADKAPVVSEPFVAREPLQPPLAVHAVALADDHVNVEVAPATIPVRLAESVTTGATGTTSAAATIQVKLAVSAPLRPSLAATVTLYVPAAVGVPLMRPVLVLIARPGGRPLAA
ncbi:MAG: hypothetical protein WBM03_01255 [Steroidobacteraceae bacterium]